MEKVKPGDTVMFGRDTRVVAKVEGDRVTCAGGLEFSLRTLRNGREVMVPATWYAPNGFKDGE